MKPSIIAIAIVIAVFTSDFPQSKSKDSGTWTGSRTDSTSRKRTFLTQDTAYFLLIKPVIKVKESSVFKELRGKNLYRINRYYYETNLSCTLEVQWYDENWTPLDKVVGYILPIDQYKSYTEMDTYFPYNILAE